MSINVRDLAKELGVSSDEVLEQLRKLYVDVEDQNSKVTDKIAGLIQIKLGGSILAKKKKPPKVKKEKKKRTVKAVETTKPSEEKKVKETKKKPEILAVEKKEEPKEPKKKVKSLRMPEIVSRAPQKAKEEKIEAKTETKTSKTGVEKITQVKPVKVVKHEIREIFDKNNEDIFKKPVYAKKGKKGKYKPVIEVVEKGALSKSKRKVSKKEGKSAAVSFRPAAVEGKQALVRKTPQKIQIQMPVSVRILAPRINIKPNLIIQYLMDKGAFVNINQDLEEEVVRAVMDQFGYELEVPQTIEAMERELMAEHHDHKKAAGIARAPVVTLMGHVDHGKTSLLDYIRKTMVTKGEKGGITQHIGAYKVEMPEGSVTFLDTPGHAAFTAMRARGANATDVVVLVVAADDGVMPQTKEAIDHARAADVPIVVAINKCDLPGANPDHVKKSLQQEGLAPEAWGGKTIMVEVSAHTGEGVDHLVEMLMLESEMLELKANPKLRARGVVIESKKTPGQGVVATLLVQNGTLRGGDVVLCGIYYGKVKAMMNNLGERIQEAFPSTPVEVLGLQGVPQAGEEFFVVKDEKKGKNISFAETGGG
ncbi:MAG: translation initiation factor IF-2 [Candidatus Omnitrophota bacterium]